MILPVLNMQSYGGTKLIVGYAMMAMFAVTYRQLYWVQGTTFTVWLALQMLLILLLCLFFNQQNLYLGFFTANFIGWYTEKRKFKIAFTCFAVLEVSLLIWNFGKLEGNEPFFLVPFVVIMLVAPFGIRSMVHRQQLEQELDKANERIKELVKREERMRIARDLHDTLGHTLSLITLKSQLVERLAAKDAERAQHEAREIQRTSRAALQQVRELVSEMRAVTVAEELAEVSEMLQSADIALEIEGDVSLENVSDLNQNILSLCLKEAVTNIVRHSGADHCKVSIAENEGQVSLTVTDNGRGLSRENEQGAGFREGNGLKGMSERLALIDGSLTITDEGEQGTSLTVRIPLIVKERKEGNAG